ncbi:alpha-mannosidase [Cohnella sp. CIP 111063]|uniref:alpha-mannosidase n=1 Tax=unclassified Cohnella TaxID=2636738 RepID=UPI000B8C6928|nr:MULTISPECIES: glycoside hydrolase family 38 C-terminal domain-containing protein [unclassified Cohnella]OXS61888.1 alpha-mannosidase [Cohnella sp. CIP 111063]PRX74343.1 alpha-mannosidase [Cohnella sp. SGD-V74]
MRNREVLFHIEKWLREKDRFIYRKIGEPLDIAYLPANKWMPVEEAAEAAFSPIRPGDKWGESWHYGWFKGTFVAPPEAEGRRIALEPDFGSESTIYINGKLAGSKDWQHRWTTLSLQAKAGERFDLLAEAYAGHDRELPVCGRTTVSVVNEEWYQFFIDLAALYQLREGLEASSLRVAEIDKGFSRLIADIDWELAASEDAAVASEAALRARAILKPLLECVNGSTVPTLFMMGQSHLDIAWLWPLEETKRKIARTLSNQLALLDEYSEYRYTQSQPYLFRMVKELYPELYGRIKAYVAEGRIIPEGGMWVEPDTNIPSGESLVRQFLYGQRFYREEFGTDSRMLWLPDVFGYSGSLPQIMRKSGIRCFASVKMFQTYDNVVDPFPYNTFDWEGIDGSSVPVHLLDYGPFPNPADVKYALIQWNERVQKEGISTRLVQFGYGDGGGGANRDDLEFLRRMGNLEGVPRTVIASPIDYFEDLAERGMPDARYVGELYYPAHRGTLTSQAKMKTGNRQAEFALREAEVWCTIASLQAGRAYPAKELEELWKRLLLLQFHDILPGTSITRVHEEAEREFEELIRDVRSIAGEAAAALTDGSDGKATFFNSLPWERTEIVELPADGTKGKGGFARVTVPAFGQASVSESDAVGVSAHQGLVVATAGGLENELLRVTLNEFGEITSLYDKETGSEWLNSPGNRFKMYRDQTSNYDAWEIDRRYAESLVALEEPAAISVVSEGPLVASVLVERQLNRSRLVQEIRLEAGSRTVKFATRIDWKERHKLLKVGFDLDLHANEALHEIQYGYAKRPNHYSRPHDADRYEVGQHKWSAMIEGNRCFSLLNDCKYGINALGSEMNLTLLRSPGWPDDRADEGVHEFTYAVHVWNDGWMSNPVVREAYGLNVPLLQVRGQAPAAGPSLIVCDADNVVIDAIKLAEDGSGDWIARAYEAKGASARCSVTIGAAVSEARETNMLEDEVYAELPVEAAAGATKVVLSFKPFEVKTLRFRK